MGGVRQGQKIVRTGQRRVPVPVATGTCQQPLSGLLLSSPWWFPEDQIGVHHSSRSKSWENSRDIFCRLRHCIQGLHVPLFKKKNQTIAFGRLLLN